MANPPTPTTPTTSTSPNTQCKGYIMAHLHPSYAPTTSDTPDPYAVVPCPHPPTIPLKISERCKGSTGARACWRQKYCDMHWCGGCKRVNGAGKDVKQVAEEVKQIIQGM
ncbi:hypothetical protein I316_02592 [Kwoniella heveanensis BCC8398]|uniref:Uncharacterized protein n=1 Tax=Kwoniella heveanensis BCC8398 TaxID=1296120 RepID=A0A1B9GWZ2_9TREE|nr:hypothetical protein I316_02592 [Kwoniella heveanensis BCC8398]